MKLTLAGSALMALLLARAIWGELDSGVEPAMSAPPLPSSPPPALVTENVDAPSIWADTVLKRPLFAPSRRPAAAAAATAQAASGQPRLVGVMRGAFGNYAVLAVPGRPKQLVIREGAGFERIQVTSISPQSVMVEVAGEPATLKLGK